MMLVLLSTLKLVSVANPSFFRKFVASLLISGTVKANGRVHDPVIKDFIAYLHLKSSHAANVLTANLPLPSIRTQQRHVNAKRAPLLAGPAKEVCCYAVEATLKLMDEAGVKRGQCPWCLSCDETAIVAQAAYNPANHSLVGMCGKRVNVSGSDGKHQCSCFEVMLPPDLNSDKFPNGVDYLQGILKEHRLASCKYECTSVYRSLHPCVLCDRCNGVHVVSTDRGNSCYCLLRKADLQFVHCR